jgi:hypothetical protein
VGLRYAEMLIIPFGTDQEMEAAFEAWDLAQWQG